MPAPVFNVLDGAGVIGGTKILVQSGKTTLLLDFGTNFFQSKKYFEEYLKPRASKGLLDAVELGLLPPVPSLYRQDLMPPGVDPWRGQVHPKLAKVHVDAVVITHAHLDHCGHLSYVRQDIPVIATIETAFLMKAIQDTSKGDLEKDICSCVPREAKDGVLKPGHWKTQAATQRTFLTLEGLTLSADAAGFWANPLGSRPLVSRSIQQVKAVGDVVMNSYPVDHSIPGCAGFALETNEGWVAYTGDIRLHGAKGELSRKFAEEVSRLKPKILFCEGTRVSRLEEEEVITEADVKERASTVIKGTRGLVIADFGSRNLERLSTFRDIAADCGRQLVLMPRDMHLLKAHQLASREGLDPALDPALLVYQEEKSSESTADKTIFATYSQKLTNSGEISRKQGQFILCFSFWDLNELIDIRPGPESVYIYSSSEAYDEEQMADMQRLRNWLDHFGITALGVPDPETGRPIPGETGLHASGHAATKDLLELIDVINPEILVPVHTELPEYFSEYYGRSRTVIIPTALEPLAV